MTSLEKPLPSNDTSTDLINQIGAAIPKSTLFWFFFSLIAAIIWTIYLAYYNSRVIGLLATLIINKLYKYGDINIGNLIKLIYKCLAEKYTSDISNQDYFMATS